MLSLVIQGATKRLVGENCNMLHVKEEILSGFQCQTSAWQPTPRELALLNAGAPVLLSVGGSYHPPVMLTVGREP